jgi:hypothetical protein
MPTEYWPARPVSFAAPRMVTVSGIVENSSSPSSGSPCGARPMRRE